jgi:hypothetical protein
LKGAHDLCNPQLTRGLGLRKLGLRKLDG